MHENYETNFRKKSIKLRNAITRFHEAENRLVRLKVYLLKNQKGK